MELEIFGRTDSSFNSGDFPVLGRYLISDAPAFGAAIQKFVVHLYFQDDMAVESLRLSKLKFDLALTKLPTVTFSRQNHNLTLHYLSRVCKGADLPHYSVHYIRELPLAEKRANILHAACLEFCQVLNTTIRSKIKENDDFDLDGFIKWIRQKEANLAWDEDALLLQLRALGNVPTIDASLPSLDQNHHAHAMSEDEFWQAIARVDRVKLSREDQKRAVAPLIKHLTKLPVDKIKSFYYQLTQKLQTLDTKEHFLEAKEAGTDDTFLYLRCYVIGMGRETYSKVQRNPKFIPDEYFSFELLLNAAPEAWAIATNDESSNFDLDWGCNDLTQF